MGKICWKCQREHAPDAAFCPYCGASFATEDMRYQTDGRTVSTANDSSYLTSAPPKYKKSKLKYVVFGVVAVIAVLIVILLIGSSAVADIEYDYKFVSEDRTDTTIELVVDIRMKNSNLNSLYVPNVNYRINASGQYFEGQGEYMDVTLAKGSSIDLRMTYSIPKAYASSSYEITPFTYIWNDWTFYRNTDLL